MNSALACFFRNGMCETITARRQVPAGSVGAIGATCIPRSILRFRFCGVFGLSFLDLRKECKDSLPALIAIGPLLGGANGPRVVGANHKESVVGRIDLGAVVVFCA